MKINEEALIQAIWTYQLKTLCKGVLHNYVGGRYGVVDESWFLNASGIHTCERGLITDMLGKQQAYKRIRSLIEDKYVTWAHKKHTFFINTPQSKEAFLSARTFWLSKGVPEGFEEGRSRCIPLENHQQLVDDCYEHLRSGFRSVDWLQLQDKLAA